MGNYTPINLHNSHTWQSYFKDLFIEILKTPDAAGNVMFSVQKAGISRRTAYDWRKKDIGFAKKWDEAVIEGRQRLKMEAEKGLRKLIKKGNVTAIIFVLKKLGPEEWGNKPQVIAQSNNLNYYSFTEKERNEANTEFMKFFNAKYGPPSDRI